MAAITQWREKGNSIYSAVLILSLMPLIQGVVAIYDKLNDLGGSIMSIMGRGNLNDWGADSSDLFVTVLMVFAYIMYFAGLTGFAKLQTGEDTNSVLRIRNGALWGVLGELLSLVPYIGWLLAFVANIVSFFVMISGYGQLKHSRTFPEEARRGAGRLRAAMIWNLIAVILHIIPLLGPIIAGIIYFILFFVVLSGWSHIKYAIPLTIAGRTIIDRLKLSDAPNGAFIAWGITLTTAVVALASWVFTKIIIPNSLGNIDWEIYNYFFYFSYILGLLLLLAGIVKIHKGNVAKGKDFTMVLVGVGFWLGACLLDLFTYVAIMKFNIGIPWMYRICNLLVITACILFIVGFRKLGSTCSDRLMREGTSALVGFFSLLLFQQLFILEVICIGEYQEEYNQLYMILPWIYLYLGVVGWRSVISGLYGKGEVMPVSTPDLQSNTQKNLQEWIPQNPEVDEQMMQRMEQKSNDELEHILANKEDYSQSFVRAAGAMLQRREQEQLRSMMQEKVLQKTDEELNQILANSEEYNPDLIEVACKERDRRKQENIRISVEKARNEEELLKYAPQNISATVESIEINPEIEQEPETGKTSEIKEGTTRDVKSEQIAVKSVEGSIIEKNGNKSKAPLIISVVLVVLLIAGALTFYLWYIPYAKNRDAMRTYVLATNLFLRSEKLAGVEYNVIGKLPYGTELITYTKDSQWAEVKANGKTGYVSSDYLLTREDFDLLNGIWGDIEAKEYVPSAKCRQALLDFYKRNLYQAGKDGWQIFCPGKDVRPNTIAYPRLYFEGSKYTDFIFILMNNQTAERMLVGYSFNDLTEAPIFRFSTSISSRGYLSSVSLGRDKSIRVKFSDGQKITIGK